MTPDKERILVVDDASDTLEVIERNLLSRGYSVLTAPSVAAAIALLESTPIDLVITDYKMPVTSGLDLLRHVRENFKDTEAMMITGYASVEGAVQAIKTGAEEYLSKPFTDEELFSAVERALGKLHARRLSRNGAEHAPLSLGGLIGESEPMKKVFDAIARAAQTNATVLITGESGTGKELVARAIHYNSPRSAFPFVPINCGGIPENLLESELFGHVKGSFTGASDTRAGFFQTADGGTIFLDEIAEIGFPMQVKLLRVLQDKEVFMVGATKGRKVDVRILAATNKELSALVKKGAFREDLFFRLNVLSIDVPPLRERGDDVLILANHFLAKFANEQGRRPPVFTDRALSILKNQAWAGNVRELENVIQKLIVMTDAPAIDAPDLPTLMRYSASRPMSLMRSLDDVEAEHIRHVLEFAEGNKTRAAQILGIDRKTLREKLKRHGLEE